MATIPRPHDACCYQACRYHHMAFSSLIKARERPRTGEEKENTENGRENRRTGEKNEKTRGGQITETQRERKKQKKKERSSGLPSKTSTKDIRYLLGNRFASTKPSTKEKIRRNKQRREHKNIEEAERYERKKRKTEEGKKKKNEHKERTTQGS